MKRKLSMFVAIIMLFAAISFAGCDWFTKKELKDATYFQTEVKYYNNDGNVEKENSYTESEALDHGHGIVVNTSAKKFGFFYFNSVETADVIDYTVDGKNFEFEANGFKFKGVVTGVNTIEIQQFDANNERVKTKSIYQNFDKKAFSLGDRSYKLVENYDAQGNVIALQNYTADFDADYEVVNVYLNGTLQFNADITRGFNSFQFEFGTTIGKATLESNDKITIKIYDNNALEKTLVFRVDNGGSEN